jgi:hypothetical protein
VLQPAGGGDPAGLQVADPADQFLIVLPPAGGGDPLLTGRVGSGRAVRR